MVKNNCSVDVLDLYDRASEIPFYWHDKEKLKSYPFFEENKQRFMDADALVIAFPVYWYSVPGILKCWIDLITSFAWKYTGGYSARPLHKIQKFMCISMTIYSAWVDRWIWRNPVKNQLKQTFKFIGIPDQIFFTIYNSKDVNNTTYEIYKQKLIHTINSFITR